MPCCPQAPALPAGILHKRLPLTVSPAWSKLSSGQQGGRDTMPFVRVRNSDEWDRSLPGSLSRFLSLLRRVSGDAPSRLCSRVDPAAIQDGDCLLCLRGPSLDVTDRIIEIASGGPWHHAAMAYRGSAGLWVVEQLQSGGGRRVSFDKWLAARHDLVDVYRPDASGALGFRPAAAVAWMLTNVPGRPYDWETIHRFARQQSWLTCWWNLPCAAEDAPLPGRYVCSTAVAAACKVGGGVHPVSRLWVGDTTPTHLARCRLLDYQFTIPGGLVPK